MIKLGDLYDICGLEGPFIIFQEILEFTINIYVEKAVGHLHLKLQEKIQNMKTLELFDRIPLNSILEYGEIRREIDKTRFYFRRESSYD